MHPIPEHSRERGVTLIEMVIVISITAIIAGAVAVFISRPVEGYADAARRAEMSDIADTALRRITRDLRTALPNSIRTTTAGNVTYLEYLQTSGGGRYRSDVDQSGGGNPLKFTAADIAFDVLGAMPSISAGDSIVIYNLGPGSGTADAYAAPPNNNRAAFSNITGNVINLVAAKLFPFSSPGKRFQVVQYPVTYACDPLPAGTGDLRRYWGYDIPPSQPTPTPASPPAGSGSAQALLASNINGCSFTYATSGVAQRTGVVMLSLKIQQSGESIQLFQQVHVTNVP
jgi:MSHA biogenesis protein MshO